MIPGLLLTAWSWLRSSRVAQIGVMVGLALLAIFVYGRMQRGRGKREAYAKSVEKAYKRLEENREIHREIRDLPLAERAQRLRDLDARR